MKTERQSYVHSLAYTDYSIKVGAGTKIWQFASVIRGAELGEDCVVASGALLDGCKFGDRCIISQNVAMGPGFVVGNDVFIGPNVVFCNDMWPRADKTHFDINTLKSGEHICIRVCDGASIGALAVILPGVEIGARAMIAAGAVVTRDVPGECVYRLDGSIWDIENESVKLHERMRYTE